MRNAKCGIGFASLHYANKEYINKKYLTSFGNKYTHVVGAINTLRARNTNIVCLRQGKEHTKMAKQLNISNTTLSFRIQNSEFRIYIKRVSLDERRRKRKKPRGCCTDVLRPDGFSCFSKYFAKITRFTITLYLIYSSTAIIRVSIPQPSLPVKSAFSLCRFAQRNRGCGIRVKWYPYSHGNFHR